MDSVGQHPSSYIHFEPSDTGRYSEETRAKLRAFYSRLCTYRNDLPHLSQRLKMTDEKMWELAHSLLDDTVFDIVQELEDIQSLSERELLHKRMKVVGRHKTVKMEINRRHRDDVARNKTKAHQLALLKVEHDQEKAEVDKKLADELKRTDQEVILELDQIVTDQQSTLYQAKVPFFSVTNNSQEIEIQMHILRFIQKLSQFKEVEKV